MSEIPMWCFRLSLILALNTNGIFILCDSALTQLSDFSEGHSTLLTTTKYSLGSKSWSGMSTTLMCARQALAFCPEVRGYIYQVDTGQCWPVLWLHEGPGETSPTVTSGEVYLTTRYLCEPPFQAVEYGTDSRVTCIFKTPIMSYGLATGECNFSGGKLVSVKTREKLTMVAQLAKGEDVWVGLDDQEIEGVFTWQEDGSNLTSEVQRAVFHPGEPNNSWEDEDCVHFQGFSEDLNDLYCYASMPALCETRPTQTQC